MAMDYQCLFDRDVSWWDQSGREHSHAHHDCRNHPKDCHYSEIPSEAAFYAGYTTRAPPRLIRLMRFSHIKSQIETQDDILPSEDVVRGLEAPELSGIPGLRFLISPPRVHPTDAHGRLRQFNPEAPLPFDSKTFGYVVTVLHFHKACLSSLPRMMPEFGQISKITGPDGITSFYVETYSYRNRWHKLSVSYVPKTMTTSIFLHNMSVDDTRSLISRILRPTIQPLTIHPMLIPVLAFEITWGFCQKELNRLFEHCITTYQALGLNNSRAFSHFRANEADNQAAAELSFGDGQDLCALEERVEFSIMMAKKLLSYFEDLEHKTPDGPLKSPFVEAGSIIQTRLEYLLDTLELQLPRLRRAKGHTILNRTGLENRTAAQSNKIQYQIALESRADSSAMKAIAVLTMLFLPGTFVSTFFAMPLFDWQAERQSEVVNSRFWIYWAVTVPGTLAVLVLWRLWWTFEEWRVRKEEEGSGVWRDIVGWVRNRGHVEMGKDSREKGHGKEGVGMM